MKDYWKDITKILETDKIFEDETRRSLYAECLSNKEALLTKSGCLLTWSEAKSTGRRPKDTYIVKRGKSKHLIDWTSPNNIPLDPETFDMVFEDVIEQMLKKNKIHVSNRVVGADPNYALPVKLITSQALTTLFAYNMFRPIPENIAESKLLDNGFTILALPFDKLDKKKYLNHLRVMENGETSDTAVILDIENKISIVYGSSYCGSVKKLMFTVMNFYLPDKGVLPVHCSANEGANGDVCLLLGLSGTGKTTLSADPERALFGDDEHGWSDEGVFNFENGCYAKLINLTKEREPEIYSAIMEKNDDDGNVAIIENAMMYPDGNIDFFDDRLTPNSRGSYLLSSLSNIKKSSMGGHPKTILFLTADANGVLPPIARLDNNQAMLWFLMGYTSKLAGTETGILEPVSAFSRFFGEPFMPRNPEIYAKMLGEKLEKHNAKVFLVNTGWIKGRYGVGERIPLEYNWASIHAAMNGQLDDVDYVEDDLFHFSVPKNVPGVPDDLLDPKTTWDDPDEFFETAKKLAQDFSNHFDKAYGDKINKEIRDQCPGK